jgi:hypothetical protein
VSIVAKTIKQSGGNYTSLIAWEAGEQTNLVTDGDIHEVYCDPFEDDAGTAIFQLSGWGISSANYLSIFGNGIGKSNWPSLPWSSTSCFTWRTSSTADAYCFQVADNDVNIEGLQVHMDSAANCRGVYAYSDEDFESMIIRADACRNAYLFYAATGTGGTSNYNNILIWANSSTSAFYCSTLGTTNYVNCCAFRTNATTFAYGFGGSSAACYNCVSYNYTSSGLDFSGVGSDDNCATSQASGTSGLSDGDSQYSITDNWTDSANLDLSFSSFSALDGNGADRSAFTTQDIQGTSRTNWHIGVWDAVATTSVSNAIDIMAEFLLEVSGGGTALPSEFLLEVSRAIDIMAEVWSDIIEAVFGLQSEVLLEVDRGADLPSEHLLELNSALPLPSEHIAELSGASNIQAEFLLTVSRNIDFVSELLADVSADKPLQAEHLLTIQSAIDLFAVFLSITTDGMVRNTAGTLMGSTRETGGELLRSTRHTPATLEGSTRE